MAYRLLNATRHDSPANDRKVMSGDSFHQRTLQRTVMCHGVGLHSGTQVELRLVPAPVNHGLVFVRVDLPEKP